MAGRFAGLVHDFRLQKLAQGAVALPGSALEHRRNAELARIRNPLPQPVNRTPGPQFLRSRGIPSGGGGAPNPGNPALLLNAPPQLGRRKRRDDDLQFGGSI